MTRKSVLVISHLYPNPAATARGPFVADSVADLARRHAIRVVSPVRWLPPAGSIWAAERRVPKSRVAAGVPVSHPRVPAVPFGGIALETHLWPARLRPLIREICGRHDVGLLHAHFGLPDGWAALRLARELRLPLVVTLWGSDALVFTRKRWPRRLFREVMASADHIVAVSNEIAHRASELGARSDRLSVIVGGVPDGYGRLTRGDARDALGLAADLSLVVWVGGLVAVKRPELMVLAFSRVLERLPSARLMLVGDGPLRTSIEKMVHRLGLESNVLLAGQLTRQEVERWQTAADIVVNTSASEGTPFSLMESLICGTRVVAVPVGGMPDLIRLTNGGTVVPDDSSEALAHAMLVDLARPRDPNLVHRARELKVDKAGKTLSSIYRSLAHV